MFIRPASADALRAMLGSKFTSNVLADHPSHLLVVLQGEDATVTVVHSKTKDAQAICAEADILIAAIGKPEMVKADWVKPGAAVIDVGTNPIPVSLPIFLATVSLTEGC